MGIDAPTLTFLLIESKKRQLGNVVTLGRQRIDLPPYWLKRLLRSEDDCTFEGYCENLLIAKLGAYSVESIDDSGYEGATHIFDMNKTLPAASKYDTVIDAGTLEHVFNVPQALLNVSTLCADRGRILHILPANNYCGHGFWQFSPELFFSLYSEKNGYSDTRIFLVSLDDWDTWYECVKPNGSRGEFRSIGRAPLLIMAATTKSGAFSHQDVQQSDYIAAWNADEESNYRPTGFREKIKNTAWWPLARRVDYALRALKAPSEDFMIRRQVSSLLS